MSDKDASQRGRHHSSLTFLLMSKVLQLTVRLKTNPVVVHFNEPRYQILFTHNKVLDWDLTLSDID